MYEHFSDYLEPNSNGKKEYSNLEKVFTSLHELYKDKILIKNADGFPNLFESTSKYHDAAYDSFVTGCAFIYMTFSQVFKPEEIMLHSNKLFMLRTLYSGFFIDNQDELSDKGVYFNLNLGIYLWIESS